MVADPSIYLQSGKYPSIQDIDQANQAVQANRLALQLQQAQVNEIPTRNQLMQLQLAGAGIANQQAQMMMQGRQAFNNALSGQDGASPAQTALGAGANAGSMGPTVANANRLATMSTPAGASGMRIAAISPDTMALGAANGYASEPLIKLWEEAKYGRPMQPGYIQHLDGTITYHGDPKVGVTLDAQGNTVQMSGAGRALAGIAGATEAGKVAGAQSQTMAPVDRLGPDGRPINKTLGQLATEAGAPNPFADQPFGGSSAPAAPAAAAPPVSSLDQLPPSAQAAATADMLKRGQDPSTMKVNGAPVNADLQGQLDAAKAGGPQAMLRFQQTMLPRLQGNPTAISGLMYDLHTPVGTPMHSMPQASAAPAAPAAPAVAGASPFMGPADAAAQKLAAEQAVHATTDAPIALNKDMLTKAHDANQTFVTNLGDVVNNEGELVARNGRLQPLLDQLPKVGGFGQDQRAEFANKLKNSGLLPQTTLDALSTKIAGGDPDAAKVVQNQLSAAAIQTMLDTLNKEGKPNRVMYQALHEQQEGLAAGKPVLQNIMSLQNQLYQQHLDQYNKATDLMAAPDYNPIRFGSQFATAKSASIQPGSGAPGAPGSAPAPTGYDTAAIAAELKRRGH